MTQTYSDADRAEQVTRARAFEAFFLARLQEERDLAAAAPGPDWEVAYRSVPAAEEQGFHVTGYVLRTPVEFLGETAGHLDVAETPDSTAESRAAVNHAACWDPVRVLLECEAKRRILERHARLKLSRGLMCHQCWEMDDGQPWPCNTLRFLALPWAGHPLYLAEWAPSRWVSVD